VIGSAKSTFDRVVIGDSDHVEPSAAGGVVDQL
jgi:hypothetical protein